MRKYKAALQPKRRYYMPPSNDSAAQRVLNIVNGSVRDPERYEPERSEVRQVLRQIVRYCDQVEAALNSNLPKRERIQNALKLAYSGLYRVFETDPKTPHRFNVFILPDRGKDSDSERDKWNLRERPPAAQLFQVTRLFMHPVGDIGVQLLWNFYQSIVQLNDLRRLRKCSGYLHDPAEFYFLRRKVQREEHYFCSDQCRSDFNYRQFIERKSDGRIDSKKGR